MTERELQDVIKKGILELGEHPCAACRDGVPFNEFPHFHGSDFGKCVRQAQYEKVVTPEPITDPETLIFLRDGHFHEESIVHCLRAGGVKVDHRNDSPSGVQTDEFVVGIRESGEIKHYPNYHECRECKHDDEIVIIGHTDGVINDRFLLECKSVKDWALKNKFNRGAVPKNYFGQMQCYMNCLGLAGGFLVVKGRHASKIIKPIFVERNPEWFDEKIQDLRNIITEMQRGIWHPCTAKSSDEKRYCDACKALGR